MKRKMITWLLVVSLVLMLGCGSSYVVSPAPDADATFDAFNMDAYDRSGTVVFHDGTGAEARNILLALDSARFVNEETGVITVVPTSTVSNVVFKNHGLGFLEGFGIGVLAGALTGLVLNASSPPSNAFGSDYVYFVMAVTGGVGGVLGGIPGLIIGHSWDYQVVTVKTIPATISNH